MTKTKLQRKNLQFQTCGVSKSKFVVPVLNGTLLERTKVSTPSDSITSIFRFTQNYNLSSFSSVVNLRHLRENIHFMGIKKTLLKMQFDRERKLQIAGESQYVMSSVSTSAFAVLLGQSNKLEQDLYKIQTRRTMLGN